MIFMPFFPRSLYSTRTVATEIIEGMILSNRSATARLTSPIWNARGVFAVTTVADSAPTTVRPRTEAASVISSQFSTYFCDQFGTFAVSDPHQLTTDADEDKVYDEPQDNTDRVAFQSHISCDGAHDSRKQCPE